MKDLIDVTKENTRLFNTINIETCSTCNRKCEFCGNAYFKRPDELMEEKTINKIIKDLSNLKYSGRIEFQSYNEPMRDKRLSNIVETTRKLIPKSCIMFNTNGDYIKSKEDIKKFYDSGLNQMEINIYDKKKDHMFKILEYCYQLKDEIGLELGGHVYKHTKKKIIDVVDKSDYLKTGNVSVFNIDKKDKKYNLLGNNGGFLRDKLKNFEPKNLDKGCTMVFRKATINWKGDMVVCCNNFEGNVLFGNVLNNTIEECWNSDLAHIYRLHLQNKQRKYLTLCKVCNRQEGFYPHMITKVTFGNDKLDKQILNTKI